MVNKVTDACNKGELLYIMRDIIQVVVDVDTAHMECTPVTKYVVLIYKVPSKL
jgi:hypothetical protein